VKQLSGVARVTNSGLQMKLLINPRAGSNARTLIEALKHIGY